MMRIFLLIFFFLSVGFNGYAQQFNVLYDYDDYANGGNTITLSDNGYIISHGARSVVTWEYSILISGYSSEGSYTWDHSMTSEDFETSLSNNNIGIIPTNDSSIYWVLGNRYNEEDDINAPLLLKVNNIGVILDTVIITDLLPINLFMLGGLKASEAIYLLCQTVNAVPLILKCNLDGNYLSHFTGIIGFQSDPKFITDVGDGLVIGGRYLFSEASNNSIQYVRKFDYDGNVQWTNHYSNGNDQLGAVNVTPLPNGNILFASSYTNGEPETASYQPYIGEIDDNTGDTLWTRRYLQADSTHRLYNFKRLSSGEYIGIGETRQYSPGVANTPYITAAFIMKLDSEFNLLWHRHYIPTGYAGGPIMDPVCLLNDFVENEDGGITALGMAFTYTGTGLQSGYIQDSWLLRVDSEGCLVSGCAVDITEHENDKHLFVYPNPANEQLNIQFPHIDKWQVSIYNMQGALVREESANQLLQYSVDIQELPSGIYTILCKNGNGKVFMEKVVKQ